MKKSLLLLGLAIMAGSFIFVACEDDDDENVVYGCTDSSAYNYDSSATSDDGSCEYEGCTDYTALNYDPEATIDDGSCEYEGCTDPEAINYNSQATVDDGSCEYEGEGIFWTDWDYGVGNISVYVEGSYQGQITGYYSSSTPDCGASSCVTITREPGTYSFYAEADDGTYWSHYITIYKNDCSTMRLYVSKGVAKAESVEHSDVYYGKPTPIKPLN